MTKIIFILVLLFLSSNCGLVRGAIIPRSEIVAATTEDVIRLQHCISLDSQHVIWTTLSTIGGALATTSSTALPIIVTNVPDEEDQRNWTISLSITGLVGSGVSLIGGFMSSEVQQDWNDFGCEELISH